MFAVADGGFLSVANDRVSILSEHAELATEVDVDEARARARGRQVGTTGPTAPRPSAGSGWPRPASGLVERDTSSSQ